MNANATYNMPPFENGSFNGTTSDYIRGIQLGYFDIPPEIAAIDVQLNDLVSLPLPVVPSIELPSCAPLLTTCVWREDTSKMENRFYPYLWFPGRPPTFLQAHDYDNIIDPFISASPMATLSQRMKMELAITASHKLVLFFETKERVAADAGPSSRWKNNLFTFMPTPEALQGISGPSPTYPNNTVFAETHTEESFPHPQNTNPVALFHSKKKTKAGASASRNKNAQARSSATVWEPQEPETTPTPPTTFDWDVVVPGYPQSQAYELGSTNTLGRYCAPLSAPTTDQRTQAAFGWCDLFGDEPIRASPQWFDADILGQGPSEAAFDMEWNVVAHYGGYNQPHVNGNLILENLTDEEFYSFICSAEQNFAVFDGKALYF